MDSKTYTPKEVAELLSCHVYTVYDLLNEGKLKGFRLGKRWRIQASELDRFMDERRAV